MESCDGVFLTTPEPYEPEAVAAVRDWFGKTGRPVYVCGPLLPPTSATATAKEQQQSTEAVQIQEFLDTTLKTSGEKSLLYVRLRLSTFGVRKRLMARFVDLVWLAFLAGQDTREDMGGPGCRDGTRHSLCECFR